MVHLCLSYPRCKDKIGVEIILDLVVPESPCASGATDVDLLLL